jgi:hypothetical protein
MCAAALPIVRAAAMAFAIVLDDLARLLVSKVSDALLLAEVNLTQTRS